MTAADFLLLTERRMLSAIDLCQENDLHEALVYSVSAGGKRLRPLSVYSGAIAICGECGDKLCEILSELAAAVELIHNYSLIHDDLPSMDNDDYRRGRPTVHKKFGESAAVLAGDMLLTLGCDILIAGSAEHGQTFASASREICSAAARMADGQSFDLRGMRDEDSFLNMYALKTAALFEGSFTAGAIAAGADCSAAAAVKRYAKYLGIAFQLADDLIDDDPQSIVGAVGRTRAQELLSQYTDKAISEAQSLPHGEELILLAQKLQSRDK